MHETHLAVLLCPTFMLDYAIEVERFDTHVGELLADLDSAGLTDNTLVIVTSDHGMPFPRVKGHLYVHNFAPDRWPCGDIELGLKDTDNSPTKRLIQDLDT